MHKTPTNRYPPGASRRPTKGSPADFTVGGTATVSAPRRCADAPSTHVIEVRLPGRRPLTLGEGCVKCAEAARFASLAKSELGSIERSALVARKCAWPVDPGEATCGLFFDAFGDAVSQRAAAEGIAATGVGIGGCDRGLDTLRVSIDDWRGTNRLVTIIQEEAARWEAGGSIAVLVTGTPVAVPF